MLIIVFIHTFHANVFANDKTIESSTTGKALALSDFQDLFHKIIIEST